MSRGVLMLTRTIQLYKKKCLLTIGHWYITTNNAGSYIYILVKLVFGMAIVLCCENLVKTIGNEKLSPFNYL